MLLGKIEILFGKVGTPGLCVRDTRVDYQPIIGRTDRASLHLSLIHI